MKHLYSKPSEQECVSTFHSMLSQENKNKEYNAKGWKSQ